MALIPLELALALTINLVPYLITHVGVKLILVIALIVMAGGLLLLLRITPEANYLGAILPALLIVGIGIGALFKSIGIAATSGMPNAEQGVAVGLMSTTQQIGNGLVLAVLVSISQACQTSALAQGSVMSLALVEGFHCAYLAAAGLVILALFTTLVVMSQRDQPTRGSQQGS